MKKNEDRKQAERLFLDDRGRIANKELAERVGVHPATIARWRRIDDWDLKLVRAVSAPQAFDQSDEDSYETDVRHIALLNARIDSYLERKELLPSEILELAEAKLHLMNCREIIDDQLRFPFLEPFGEDVDEFD